ncbi:hypothetical protein N0V82_000592 [Gnomoniopsis sp. IMI 355080]|nr:hypothetical protein N0V82_000592 [Gnomoniopsis sp. IMI 355080]
MIDVLPSAARCLALGLLALSAFPQTLGCGYHNSKRFLEAKAALDRGIYGPANLAKRQRGGDPLATLRILNPYPGVYAYYDGRTGDRFWSQEPNWLDDGAFTLGVSTYAVVDGNEALLYDTHITQEHAAAMLAHVTSLGVNKTTVVFSHYHNDHIAGAVVFSNVSELVGNTITAQVVQSKAPSLPSADPPIVPVLPRKLYNDTMQIMVGTTAVELHHFNIHTEDGTILYLPQRNLLFAGDTLEDTATFISKPADLSTHAAELARMYATFPADAVRILPAHGSPDRIAAGGYRTSFINATLNYIGKINEPVAQPAAWNQNLSEVVAADVASGTLLYFAQYEAVHQGNVQSVMEVRAGNAQKQGGLENENEANRMRLSCLWVGGFVAAFWVMLMSEY